MAESTKIEVRLVRCPKCENLLPEPKDCSFFKCGGCGTILCAKNKNSVSDNNRAKETEVNLNCSSREEEEEESLDNVETQSGLDRFKKKRREDFFRFSGSNYFQESLSTDEAIKQDRAGLLRKLDKLKEQGFKNPTSRFFSSGKPPFNPAAYRDPLGFPIHERAHPHYTRQYIARNGMFHQSSCSCSYDPYHRASGSVIPPSGLPDAFHNVGFYHHHHERNIGFGSSLHSPRALSRFRLSSSRVIRPVAGGAPFITCKNCFKLLKLPDLVTRKLRCGACFCLIEFSFTDNNKLLLLSTNTASVRKQETHRRLLHYEFNSTDDVSNDAPVSIILEKAQEMQIADSEELCSENSTVKTLTTQDSPLCENFDYSSSINVRNRSFRAVAIEIDESFNESEVSQDSANDENRDDDQVIRRITMMKKKSGFTSIVKNSFKDLKKTIQSENSNVSINGNPLPERLVKLVEKQAGPIRPGNYWYDYRAGFWGVMGNHCLGILPPFIEELNYPMPENCANGNTSVFVNGRELHQKDLRLLAARGLPRDKDRSYTVYISGRVIDEDTGEELNSLGKLAPTVDKLKRGFGMRVPRRAA